MKECQHYILALLGLMLLLSFSSFAHETGWPRTIKTTHSTVTLAQAPQRIISTSITITGTLLAINAPVIASGAITPNTRLADKQGFFRQWGEIAAQRGVKALYIGEPNAEAIAVEAPDLIIMSTIGSDSALKIYDQLSSIAPVLVLNYEEKSWQQLAEELGKATGKEQQAAKIITEFAKQAQATKQQINLPPQPVCALVFRADGKAANLWRAESPQGQLLQQLGFSLATPPAQLSASTSMGIRKDIIQLSGENLAAGLNGQTLLLFGNDDSEREKLLSNKLLAHLPAVQQKRVYALGNETFRLDYYSASQLLSHLKQLFPAQN